MTIGAICNREVVCVTPDTSIPGAVALMRKHHVGDVVVAEQRSGRRYPVGILTDRDIVIKLLAGDVEPDRVTVADAMSFELLAVPESLPVIDVIERMRDRGVRRAPVVSADGALVGIISVDDLLDHITEQLNDVVMLINREPRREAALRPITAEVD